uniref:endo alpha-1,4 polygalactosaminidase n=2 Tax=Roseivirga sp. TaxID=1964215 RepID=UPI0040489A30
MAFFSMFGLKSQESAGSVFISYGDINPDKIRGYKYVIVESEHFTSFDVKRLKENNQVVLGYISLGEVSVARYYFESIKDKTLGKNKVWESYFLDLSDNDTKNAILGLIQKMDKKGFNGLFLDTVDTFSEWGPYPERGDILIEFLAQIKEQFPDFYLMQNAGLSLLPKSKKYINSVAIESVASDYSFEAKEYKIRKSNDFYQKLAMLKSVKSKHDLSIVLIEYADTQKLFNRIKHEIAPLKWDFFIGNIDLQGMPSFKK